MLLHSSSSRRAYIQQRVNNVVKCSERHEQHSIDTIEKDDLANAKEFKQLVKMNS